MSKRIILHIVYFLSFLLLLFLTLNKHSKRELFHYRSEIYSDKAGYYIYLPYLINYEGDANKMPKKLENVIGGFEVDTLNNRVKTKYTAGVAIMELPFYLIANASAPIFGQSRTGFSEVYFYAIDIAAVFYLLMAMILFANLLRKLLDIEEWLGFVFSWVLLLSTNLFWYGIDETGMSHVFSFFLFTAYLFLFLHFWEAKKPTLKSLMLIGIVTGLIVLVRPINMLFLPSALFVGVKNFSSLKQRIRMLFNIRVLPWVTVFIFLILLPQFIYWKYTYDHFFHYAYGAETFNWLNPNIDVLLFSPGTGLFPFNPIYILFVGAIIYLIIKKRAPLYWFTFFLLVLITYVFSCWHDPGYGCSFGSRPFIEFSVLLSIPFFAIISFVIKNKQKRPLSLLIILIACSILFNLKLSYTFDGCFYGENIWDWSAFWKFIT